MNAANAAAQPPTRVWIDGSCLGNPGRGGWAAWRGDGQWISGSARSTTNNAMELTAALAVLRHSTGPLVLVCDSKYTIDCLTKWRFGWAKRGWVNAQKQPVANQDVIKECARLLDARRNVTFEWVKGHSNDRGNNAVDALARAAAGTGTDVGVDTPNGPGLGLGGPR